MRRPKAQRPSQWKILWSNNPSIGELCAAWNNVNVWVFRWEWMQHFQRIMFTERLYPLCHEKFCTSISFSVYAPLFVRWIFCLFSIWVSFSCVRDATVRTKESLHSKISIQCKHTHTHIQEGKKNWIYEWELLQARWSQPLFQPTSLNILYDTSMALVGAGTFRNFKRAYKYIHIFFNQFVVNSRVNFNEDDRNFFVSNLPILYLENSNRKMVTQILGSAICLYDIHIA